MRLPTATRSATKQDRAVILIVTVRGDLHAAVIRKALTALGVNCHILESDRVSASHCLHWQCDGGGRSAYIRLQDGTHLDLASVALIWWRRIRASQDLDREVASNHATLIHHECRTAIEGLLTTCFDGVWISHPTATVRAENKLLQLAVARECGFRIPRTLITQSKNEVVRFARELRGAMIVKPITGVAEPMVLTRLLRHPARMARASYEACPAIFQELISGQEHIRLNCFGDESYAALIEAADLDWRADMTVPIRQWPVPPDVHKRVRRVLARLGLAMGVFDFKRMPDGELVWLEVNPQGQFLFLEPILGLPLSDIFAQHLVRLLPSHVSLTGSQQQAARRIP